MPEMLRDAADFRFFPTEFGRAVITMLGRLTHAAAPDRSGRRRLVLSGAAQGIDARPNGV